MYNAARACLLTLMTLLSSPTTLAADAPAALPAAGAEAPRPAWMDAATGRLVDTLVARHGESVRARAARGVAQAGSLWRAGDGDEAAFEAFVLENFLADPAVRDAAFDRLDRLHEQLDGSLLEIGRAFRWQTDLDLGPILPMDRMFAAYSAGAHVRDDFFANKIAFVVLLNFPLATLEEKLRDGPGWTPRQWAEVRLAERYDRRVPAAVTQAFSSAVAGADTYISTYNVWMHHLLDDQGNRLFPAGLRLITHWNLRDELKAQYADPQGLPRQRMIARVMERIVTQTIPADVIDNPHADWNPYSNEVRPAAVNDSDLPRPDRAPTAAREADSRYQQLLNVFNAARLADPYSPASPTFIARRFDDGRELSEARVEAMLTGILGSPMVPRVAKLIEKRLGRPLEPFDIWYSGFLPRGQYTEAELDAVTRERYPTPAAFEADIPRILVDLGFSEERARYVAQHITVDPSRGAGHAMGAQRRGDKAHLRTRVGPGGMDYKGYNIAVHELGHNVEQTFSLYDVPFHAIEGVPNTAFTEALAFLFQENDLALLGLSKPDETTRALQVLDDFWGAAEIGAVALVDMRVWRWMYDHPGATAAELRDATLGIARDVWNRYFAEALGQRDVVLLGIYSHMIDAALYLPDYPIGAMIAQQVKGQVERTGNLGAEFERMTTQGRLAPDLWMTRATGAPVGPEALLAATEKALQRVE